MKTIVDRIGLPALLEQTAEECTELAHACLKEARRLRGENPTPCTAEECKNAIMKKWQILRFALIYWTIAIIRLTLSLPKQSWTAGTSALTRPESEGKP